MSHKSFNIVILGLSITSSWGNGHATTFRGLVRELAARGHQVLFLEREMPWYASTRDLTEMPPAQIALYKDLEDLQKRFRTAIAEAEIVIVGSYVPEGIALSHWMFSIATGLTAFYDIDTPITLAGIQRGDIDYISAALVPRFHLYLSFTGGPTLERIEGEFGSPMARALYCAVDPGHYYPVTVDKQWDLGFLGTYSPDRQPPLEELFVQPAGRWSNGRFAVAGAQYPPALQWPSNVTRIEHLPPASHRPFYNQQVFTLNLTRADMIRAGFSPSVRLFEAAACGVPIISDYWDGLEEFFEIGEEVLVSRSAEDTLKYLRDIPPASARQMGDAARRRVLTQHTANHRARELEGYFLERLGQQERREPLTLNAVTDAAGQGC